MVSCVRREGWVQMKQTHMTSPKAKFGKAITMLLWLTALGVLAQNVILLRQNRRLRDAAAPQIAAGADLLMLAGLNLDGRSEPIGLPSAGSKLVIITFSPGCPACQANQEGWTKLANALGQKGIRVLWVSRDPIDITREYCLKHGIPVSDTVADPPYRTYVQLGLARVPNTLLIGAGGTVEKVWPGRLDQAGWNSMFAYFDADKAQLPGAAIAVGAVTADCESGSADASAKSCK